MMTLTRSPIKLYDENYYKFGYLCFNLHSWSNLVRLSALTSLTLSASKPSACKLKPSYKFFYQHLRIFRFRIRMKVVIAFLLLPLLVAAQNCDPDPDHTNEGLYYTECRTGKILHQSLMNFNTRLRL